MKVRKNYVRNNADFSYLFDKLSSFTAKSVISVTCIITDPCACNTYTNIETWFREEFPAVYMTY